MAKKNRYKIDPRLLERPAQKEPHRDEAAEVVSAPIEKQPKETIITLPIHPKRTPEGQAVSPGEGKKKEQMQLFWARVFVAFSFCGTLFFIGMLSLFMEKPTESEYEKRTLATMPEFSLHELFWGSYLRDVELYYADTFPFRDNFVKLAAAIEESRGVRAGGVRLIEAAPSTSPQEVQQQEKPLFAWVKEQEIYLDGGVLEEEERRPFEMEDDGAEGEQTGDGLFIYKGRAMSIFGGSQTMGSWYAEVLSGFAQSVGPDVNVYSVIVPTSIEFYLPERYKSVTNPEKPAIEFIYGELDGVTGVDAYTAIHYHADEYVYFNTDHHWTALGAYYAYTAYCEAAGLEPLSLEDYEARRIDGEFLGTFYNQSNDSELEKNYDTVEYYIVPGEFETYRYDRGAPNEPVRHSIWAEKVSGSNGYLVFLGSDFPLMHITTGNKNGKKAVIIKDSFGNAFAPFLLAHYEELYIVDHRYFEKGLISLVRDEEIDDVIFMMNIFAANTRMHIERLEGIMY